LVDEDENILLILSNVLKARAIEEGRWIISTRKENLNQIY
jgi:hypothetical protein